jgi:hypothetical protein
MCFVLSALYFALQIKVPRSKYEARFSKKGVTRIEKTVEHDVSTAGVPAPQGSGWWM